MSASKKVHRRVQEHETGIEMHDLSKVVCGDRADRQAAMPISSGTLLRTCSVVFSGHPDGRFLCLSYKNNSML